MTLPDSPLANAAVIDQNSATPATTIADRIDLLNQNGHGWMPADMQTTLAGAPTSDSSLLSIANSIKSTLSKTWNGFTEATDDNVLHKQPTAGLALTRMLNSSLGPLPVAEPDLTSIQKNLQAQGFGADLPTNGVWGADWNDAYNGWSNHIINRQLAGDQPGSISTQSAGHSIWDDLLPSHAVNAIVGYAKSLPGDVRDLAANLVGSTVNTVTGHETKSSEGLTSPGAQAAQDVESLLGNPKARQKVQAEIAHPWASTLQDVGTVLSVSPIAGQGSAAARVAEGEFERGMTLEAAQRGPGVVAKSFFGGLERKAITDAGEQEGSNIALQPGRHIIANIGERADSGLRRGALNSNVIRNIPLLGQVGPVMGRLADADGAYYKVRTLLATPYAVPAVRVAGDLGQRTMLTGAAIRGGAQLEQALGGPNSATTAIQNNNTTSDIDRNLDRIMGTPGQTPFTDLINGLGFVLHGPLGDTVNSERVGDAVQALQGAVSKMQGDYAVEGAWERAITTATGKHTTIEDLQKAFGGEENANRFINMKVAELAAAHAAQKTTQETDGLQFGEDGYRAAVGQHADEVWADPAAHTAAMRELTADKTSLQNRLAADALRGGLSPRNYNPDEITDIDGVPTLEDYATNGQRMMEAGNEITQLVRNGGARELFGANGKSAIRAAEDSFDFGDGQDNPVRLLDTTRRQYVNQTSRMFTRVKNGVNKARVQLGQERAAAQAKLIEGGSDERNIEATNSLKAAKLRTSQAERAISNGDMQTLASLMKESRSTKSSDAEWDQLVKDHRQFKQLITPTLAPGESYNLADMIDRGIDPDSLYTRVNGEPRVPSIAPGSAEWIRNNLAQENGTLGLARLSTKSIQQATADIIRLEQKATQAKTPEELDAGITALRDYGFHELGLTDRTLGVYADPLDLADRLQEHAQQLASDVFLPMDAAPSTRAAVARMNELGYKPMMGSHIGHIWDGSLPPLEDLKGSVSKGRKIWDGLGLSTRPVSSLDKAQDTQIRVLREVDRAFHDPKFKAPPRTTAETALEVLRDDKLLPRTLPGLEKQVFTATKSFGLHNKAIAQLAESKGLDIEEAARKYEESLGNAIQVRDLPRARIVKALTEEGTGTGPNGQWEWPGMDKASANLIYRGIQRAYGDRPNYLVGLSSLEDWVRGGFYLWADKLAVKFPDTGFLQAFADAPNKLIVLRNRLRFDLSFMFDARRLTKTNVKMGLDGVPAVFDPLAHMVKNGTFDKAHDLLNSLVGEPQYAGFDDADRYLHSQSIWGKYNSRHFEAYYAQEKKTQGASDDEIRQGIRRVFEYGSTRTEGRTPLESTVNTLFFPFSFEKNLLRNTGAYFLDHPQQALLLTSAMEGYRHANSSDEITNWAQDHLPLLNDLQKLNAFAHGISPGQAGGINAPLLNLFLPQLWSGKDFTEAKIKEVIPAWKDLGSLMSDSISQGEIARNALENAASYAVHLGAPRSPFDPYKPTTTAFAQRRDAEVMRNTFISALTPVLDHNAHATVKVNWPDDGALPPKVQGQPIDRTTIGYLVQRWYPAYDPSFSQTFAVQQEDAANNAIAALKEKSPAEAQQWGVLVKMANSISTRMNDNTFDTAEAAQVMGQFRELSLAAAEQDPGFNKFYTEHFQWLVGPIESVKGVG